MGSVYPLHSDDIQYISEFYCDKEALLGTPTDIIQLLLLLHSVSLNA